MQARPSARRCWRWMGESYCGCWCRHGEWAGVADSLAGDALRQALIGRQDALHREFRAVFLALSFLPIAGLELSE